jgi:hypothetical protein
MGTPISKTEFLKRFSNLPEEKRMELRIEAEDHALELLFKEKPELFSAMFSKEVELQQKEVKRKELLSARDLNKHLISHYAMEIKEIEQQLKDLDKTGL